MKNLIIRYLNDNSGATAMEYGLIVAFLSIAILASVLAIGAWGVDVFELIRTYVGIS